MKRDLAACRIFFSDAEVSMHHSISDLLFSFIPVVLKKKKKNYIHKEVDEMAALSCVNVE